MENKLTIYKWTNQRMNRDQHSQVRSNRLQSWFVKIVRMSNIVAKVDGNILIKLESFAPSLIALVFASYFIFIDAIFSQTEWLKTLLVKDIFKHKAWPIMCWYIHTPHQTVSFYNIYHCQNMTICLLCVILFKANIFQFYKPCKKRALLLW